MTIINTTNIAKPERKVYNPKTDGEMVDYEPTDEDEMGLRVLELEGRVFNLQIRQPHGHCFIKPEKGKVPDELSGAYTSPSRAEMAIKRYLGKQEKK